jgi:hypothetical protein
MPATHIQSSARLALPVHARMQESCHACMHQPCGIGIRPLHTEAFAPLSLKITPIIRPLQKEAFAPLSSGIGPFMVYTLGPQGCKPASYLHPNPPLVTP